MASLKPQISPYSQGLTALLVEDDAASRTLISAQLRGVFKELLQAPDGEQGLAAFRTHRPQVVLTDNRMPGLTGLEMTAAIRQLDPKVPVIFITASMDTPVLVQAIRLGIAAIVPKPVLRNNLRQAVAQVVGLLENDHLHRTTVDAELALLQYREKYHEFQQEFAFRKQLSLMENDFFSCAFTGLPECGQGEWITQVGYAPHDPLCGDSYSLRRLPDGSQLIFLADAMGKGLAAALTASLSVTTFNLQADALVTGAPFGFRAFVQRLLPLLRQRLLEDEVLALALAYLPATRAPLEIAAFGMPPILLVDHASPVQKLPCNNPPLSSATEDFNLTIRDLGTARSLLVYTDGLNEAPTLDGSLYRSHLNAAFQAHGGIDQFWRAFRDKVAQPEDDVTFLLLYRIDATPRWSQRLEFTGRLAQVDQACAELETLVDGHAPFDPSGQAEFAMAIREAMLNAYEHGSLEIPAGLKRQLLEDGSYYEHLLAQETTRDRRIVAVCSLQTEGDQNLLKVTIQDEGPGFTPPKSWAMEADSLLLSGRGLKMINKYTDAFHFNEKGNVITLIKLYPRGTDASPANQCH